MTNIEAWLPVPDWEGEYEVSHLGRVRSVERERIRPDGSGRARPFRYPGKLIVPSVEKNGRRSIGFSRDGKQTRVKLASLVLETFDRPRPPGAYVWFEDGDYANCSIENLSWETFTRQMVAGVGGDS